MRFSLRMLCGAVTAAAAAAPLRAQTTSPRPIELGVDAGVNFGLSEPKLTTVSVPIQNFRVGFFVSDAVSIEPLLSLNRISGDGGSFTNLDADVGLLAHFASTPNGSRVYVRPFVGISTVSADFEGEEGSDTETQFNAGAGLGLKVPIQDRLAWRFEALYTRAFKSDNVPASNNLGLNVGLSFFTR